MLLQAQVWCDTYEAYLDSVTGGEGWGLHGGSQGDRSSRALILLVARIRWVYLEALEVEQTFT